MWRPLPFDPSTMASSFKSSPNAAEAFEDTFPAAEKILSDIENIFKKDKKLARFEILPVSDNENKSPIHHAEHCLALESWCVKHVYCHAYSHAMALRRGRGRKGDYSRTNMILLGALLLKPDLPLFWNMRKELINMKKIDPAFELHFTEVVLSYKPKCAEVFFHRKWLISDFMKGAQKDINLWDNELQVCEIAADRYSSNYHAWTHRIWCLSQYEKCSSDLQRLYAKEWKWSEKWITFHISDYSGFYYRQHLITKLCTEPSLLDSVQFMNCPNIRESLNKFFKSIHIKELSNLSQTIQLPFKLLIFEIVLNSELMFIYTDHESLWSHRKFILQLLKKIVFKNEFCERNKYWGCVEMSRHLSPDGTPLQKNLKLESNETSDWLSVFLSCYEFQFLQKCSLSYSPQEYFVNKHKMWLDKLLKFQLPTLTTWN